MPHPNQPTPAELEILDVLWDRRKATVREVHQEISKRKSTAYTTVLKLMQIMHEKGLVKRDDSAADADEDGGHASRQGVSRIGAEPGPARTRD